MKCLSQIKYLLVLTVIILNLEENLNCLPPEKEGTMGCLLTSPQSFIITIFFVGLTTLGTFIIIAF